MATLIRPTCSPARRASQTLDLYRQEGLFERAKALEPTWADAAMSLKGLPNVLDVRTVGITAGIDLASKPDAVGKRAYDAMEKAFHEEGIMIRNMGDTLAVTPPLIVSESQTAEIFDKMARVIRAVVQDVAASALAAARDAGVHRIRVLAQRFAKKIASLAIFSEPDIGWHVEPMPGGSPRLPNPLTVWRMWPQPWPDFLPPCPARP